MFQIHDIGHRRDQKTVLVGVKDFTPPFIGTNKIAQFAVSSRLGLGAWLIGGALALQLARRVGQPPTPRQEPDKKKALSGAKSRPAHSGIFTLIMKATRILFISGVLLLVAVFVTGIYIVPKLQSGSPATARQSDASRVSLSDVFLDATYATPEFVKRVKLEAYLQQWEGRAQPFLIGINTHVGTIAHLDLQNKVLIEDSNGDRYPSLGTAGGAERASQHVSAGVSARGQFRPAYLRSQARPFSPDC